MIDGQATLDGDELDAGDAAKVFGPHDLTIVAGAHTELILIDVPMQFRPVGVWAGPPVRSGTRRRDE